MGAGAGTPVVVRLKSVNVLLLVLGPLHWEAWPVCLLCHVQLAGRPEGRGGAGRSSDSVPLASTAPSERESASMAS